MRRGAPVPVGWEGDKMGLMVLIRKRGSTGLTFVSRKMGLSS